ncbi:MAG: type II toxin-antitoxin system RelE/ParE family toxin [Nanoarchaeota archaeon]
MNWIVERADSFLKDLSKYRKNSELLNALDNKIKRLEIDPENVGGMLSGRLHGKQSTRLIRKFRLIFQINESERKVYLVAIDHRKDVYE